MVNKRAKIQREYLASTFNDRPRLIVRMGEILVTLIDEEDSWEGGDSGPELSELQAGPGIKFDAQRKCWFATITGYLAIEGTQLEITPLVVISATKEAAFLDLRAPATDEEPVTRKEIVQALQTSEIKHGLASQRVEVAWTMFKSNGRLPGPIRIAQGTAPDPGKPAGIDYSAPAPLTAGLIDDPDEPIDYHERNLVTNVMVGDQIGCWLPAREATPGTGVDGSVLEPDSRGEDVPLRVGANIATAELEGDGVQLTAEIEGMLVLDENGTPSVTDILELDGDVDFETGNIDARGSVVINGNVRGSFVVKATGDITVRGVVEGANLQAQGQITIEKALLGAATGKVFAVGDIYLNNSQNADIESYGNIHINGSDTGSQLNCSGEIYAMDGRGALRGGHYQAGGSVRVRSLGSDLGVPTLVIAGLDPIRERKRERLRLALNQVREGEEKAARAGGIEQGADSKASRKAERLRTRLSARLERLKEQEPTGAEPVIVSLEQVYYGVNVNIRERALSIESSTDGRRFLLDRESGEIEVHPL